MQVSRKPQPAPSSSIAAWARPAAPRRLPQLVAQPPLVPLLLLVPVPAPRSHPALLQPPLLPLEQLLLRVLWSLGPVERGGAGTAQHTCAPRYRYRCCHR